MLVFVCTANLAILDRLDEVDEDMLSWWLAERQLPNGGLNGRPEKLEDVCVFDFPCISLASCTMPSKDASLTRSFRLSLGLLLILGALCDGDAAEAALARLCEAGGVHSLFPGTNLLRLTPDMSPFIFTSISLTNVRLSRIQIQAASQTDLETWPTSFTPSLALWVGACSTHHPFTLDFSLFLALYPILFRALSRPVLVPVFGSGSGSNFDPVELDMNLVCCLC
jgi:hypothetical protein